MLKSGIGRRKYCKMRCAVSLNSNNNATNKTDICNNIGFQYNLHIKIQYNPKAKIIQG